MICEHLVAGLSDRPEKYYSDTETDRGRCLGHSPLAEGVIEISMTEIAGERQRRTNQQWGEWNANSLRSMCSWGCCLGEANVDRFQKGSSLWV